MKRKLKESRKCSPIVAGPVSTNPVQVNDLLGAVRRGVEESTRLIIDWTCDSSKRIGSRCKVYWDGDFVWFYGRILNYDSNYNKYYIYYESDNTAEWIDIDNEFILISEEIVLAKPSSTPWPAMKFWISPKAMEIVQKMKGYKIGGEYVEYFNAQGLGEYAFLLSKALFPLNEQFIPKFPSKTFTTNMESARKEQEEVYSVIEVVLSAVKKAAYGVLSGQDWVGLRVRSSTSAIPSMVDDTFQSNKSAKCVGTVVLFCPRVGKHLVLFDEELLTPQWVQCNQKHLEVLIGPEETYGNQSIPFLRHINCKRKVDCTLCGLSDGSSTRLVQCVKCLDKYHSYCLPAETYDSTDRNWTCLNCIVCYSCNATAWNRNICDLNIRTIEPSAVDKDVKVCDQCLLKYNNKKDFCPVCCRVYKSELEPQQSQAMISDENALDSDVNMMECDECSRWVHAQCESIDSVQYQAITDRSHPVWRNEYLCPPCRINNSIQFIDQISALDETRLFAEPVTENMALNYFDVIRNPMDLSTMKQKAKKGHYKSTQSVRQDVELMILNAMVFNKEGTEYWREASVFHSRLLAEIFPRLKFSTTSSAYGGEIVEILKKSKSSAKIEVKRRAPVSTDLIDFVDAKGNPIVKNKRIRESLPDTEIVDHFVSEDLVDTFDSTFLKISDMQEIVPVEESDDDETPTDIIYPTDLIKSPCADTYMSTTVAVLSVDAAVYICCLDSCLSCGSSGSADDFVFCVDCGEAFHSFCVSIPIKDMSSTRKKLWRCGNCKVCEICGDSTEQITSMIYCEGCDQAFHMHCVSPIISEVPSGKWFCSECVTCCSCQSQCWGQSKDFCILCLKRKLEIERDNQKVLRVKRLLVEAKDIICASCNKFCTRDYLRCSFCHGFSHITCYPHLPFNQMLHLEGRFNSEWMCKNCDMKVSNSNKQTHLGPFNDNVRDILFKVSNIQSRRLAEKIKKKSMKYEKILNDSEFNSEESIQDRCLAMITIIKSAIDLYLDLTARHKYLSKYASLTADKYTGGKIFTLWNFGRANRFVALINRKSESLKILKNFQNGKDDDGVAIPLDILSRYAAMASAFMNAYKFEMESFTNNSIMSKDDVNQSNIISTNDSKNNNALVESIVNISTTQNDFKDRGQSLLSTNTYEDFAINKLANDLSNTISLPPFVSQSNYFYSTVKEKWIPGGKIRRNFKNDSLKLLRSVKSSTIDIKLQLNANSSTNLELTATPTTLSTDFKLSNLTAFDSCNKSEIGYYSKKQIYYNYEQVDQNTITVTNRQDPRILKLQANLKSFQQKCEFLTETVSSNTTPNISFDYIESTVIEKTLNGNIDFSMAISNNHVEPQLPRRESIYKVTEPHRSWSHIHNGNQIPARNMALDDSNIIDTDDNQTECSGHSSNKVSISLSPLTWTDPRRCLLCHDGEIEGDHSGRLISFGEKYTCHVNCLRLSVDVLEKDGVLLNAKISVDRSINHRCWLCSKIGASVCCTIKRSCKSRRFHFKCAAAAGYSFFETKHINDPIEDKHPIYCLSVCPEHQIEIDPRHFPTLMSFQEPKRFIVADASLNQDSPFLVSLLSQKRIDIALKAGSLSIHSLGHTYTNIDQFSMHTQSFIYPHYFRSTRIYWSYRPLQRSCYTFEIFHDNDFQRIDPSDVSIDKMIDCCKEMLTNIPEYIKLMAKYNLKTSSMTSVVFRVTSMDMNHHNEDPVHWPVYTRSIEEAYCAVECLVDRWRENISPDFRSRIIRDSYGLDPHQFFGLGVSFVRHAIESMQESVAAMTAFPPTVRYLPSYVLPNSKIFKRLQQLRKSGSRNLFEDKLSKIGSSRADSIESHIKRDIRRAKMTKVLAKAVDIHSDDLESNKIIDDEARQSRLELSRQYYDLSSAYIANPNSKLIVKKSHIHGYGLFSRTHFDRNDMIIEYIGQKIRQIVADRREVVYEDEGVGSCYLFRLDKFDIIDATRTGGMARFMNHCCEPNAFAKIVTSVNNKDLEDKHIVIMAARDIEEGEEITYDYKFPIEDTKLKCYCSSPKCLGFLN